MPEQLPSIDRHTAAWTLQVWLSFLISLTMLTGGIAISPTDLWVKGYLAMGTLFVVGSTFSLAKTVRDNHEAEMLRNRVTRAKTDKLLKEFELTDAA